MRNTGFKNEKKLIKSLNNKYFSDLTPNLQRLIAQSFQNYEGLILCTAEAGLNKSDIKIKIGNEAHTYSIKMGKGNSVHQEPLENFLIFLEKEYTLSSPIKRNIQSFIWADGTFDGSGEIKIESPQKSLKKETLKLLKRYKLILML